MNNSKRIEMALQLNTHDRFYSYWFEQLSKPENSKKTKTQIFEEVNDLYREIFNTDKGKYSSYNSFQTVVSRLRKNR